MGAIARDAPQSSALWFSHPRWEDHVGDREACALNGGLARGEALRHSTALGSLSYITSEAPYSPWYSLAKVTETRDLSQSNIDCLCTMLAVRGSGQRFGKHERFFSGVSYFTEMLFKKQNTGFTVGWECVF